MDRLLLVLLAVAAVPWVVGCSNTADSSQFRPYKEVVDRDVPVSDAKPGTTDVTDGGPAVTGTETATMEAPDPAVAEIPVSALAPVNVVDGTSISDVLKVTASGSNAQPTAPGNTSPPAITTLKPGGIQLLVPHREFKIEGPQNAMRVSYDDLDLLKILNMEPVPEDALKHFPSWLKALDGQRVRLRGFMYPTFQATGIDQFVLARDNQICCFGRNPKVYDLVSVQMRDGVTTDYIQNRPFDVIGILRIDLLTEGGEPMGLYWLEDSVVINK